jgi:sigma-B regulation protein RsbU (phosphoserine phosphatase)
MHQKTLGVAVLINRRDRASFTQQDQRLLKQLGAQAALTVDLVRAHQHEREQRRLEQELEVAHNFQEMLLPRELPSQPGLDIAAYSTPALELGGDYYDFIWVEKPLFLGVAIVDVSGKGVPGALVMTILRSALRACAPGNASPKKVLEEVNRMIIEDTKQNVFITMTYAIIDIRSKKMRFVRAGHEPLVLIDENSDALPKIFQPKGIALGLVAPEMFNVLEEQEIDLREGQTVLLYTDGVVEAVNENDQEYGPERFRKNLQKHKTESAQHQINNLLEDIRSFTGGIAQHDDITVAAFKVVAEEENKDQ